jgi:putative hydrolase of HD superfamily
MTDRQLLTEALSLKSLPRAGWLRVGKHDPESVAAHSWGVALAALVRCPPELNREKVLAMAILHDLAEARVGDITPHDRVPKEEKHRRERLAILSMLHSHPHLKTIWDEVEAGLTPEARFVREMDRLDLGLTAEMYGQQGTRTAELLAVGAEALAKLGR